MASRSLSIEYLNEAALRQFIDQPVGDSMISFLANATHNIIPCKSTLPRTKWPQLIYTKKNKLPTLNEFITQLVNLSKVKAPTFMSTLVYLNRLKSKLRHNARGQPWTLYGIFLAALILSAKNLNDASPKNKQWADYTRMITDDYRFGFTCVEVNLMERQLLSMLGWELIITKHDLYRELDFFLNPLRIKLEKHVRCREKQKQGLYPQKKDLTDSLSLVKLYKSDRK
ncbi:hypothetical protein TrVGV298_007037 [Trichoderma virens]|nr:hypothetical protein TrVGV298_007037 [Trichoderma virens]